MSAPSFEWEPVKVLPDGRLKLHVVYLEMHSKPEQTPPPSPGFDVRFMRALRPTVSFYRYLYRTVGEPWLWTTYNAVSDEELRAIIQHDDTEIHVLYADGVPAGYAHLGFQGMPDAELLFFGLVPEFIGKGFGPVLLHYAVEAAWAREPARFWLHTCSGDHPKAVSVYRRAGFVPYKDGTSIIDDPRPAQVPSRGPEHGNA